MNHDYSQISYHGYMLYHLIESANLLCTCYIVYPFPALSQYFGAFYSVCKWAKNRKTRWRDVVQKDTKEAGALDLRT